MEGACFVGFDVVILPSFAQVESWCKQHADEQVAGLFAQTVTTFGAWIADLWELHGDGRALVSDVQRALLVKQALAQTMGNANMPGHAALAASYMRDAAGVASFEDVLDAVREGAHMDGVSMQEAIFLRALVDYKSALDSLGLVEAGEAASLLAQRSDEVFPRQLSVLMSDAPPLSWVQAQFLSSCSQLEVIVDSAKGSDGVPQAPAGVDVRFAFPAGRLAQPGLIADEAMQCADMGNVVVVSKDPLALFARVRNRLAAQGFQVRVQAPKSFDQTDFGRAFLAMHRCLHDDPWDGAALTDVLLSPFSDFSRNDAFKIDKAVRGNRMATREDVIADLRIRSEAFSQLEELATDPDADVLIGVFEHMVQAMAHRSPAWRAEQLAAMGALRETTVAARRVHADIDACASVLERVSVPIAIEVLGTGPSITFTTQAVAARMGSGCCQALILADLTSEDYPVADREDALVTLAEKIGMPPKENALSKARRDFYALLGLPEKALVVVRSLGDDNADPTYPSVVLEEFIDAYRVDPSATDDIDNKYRLPESLQRRKVERGEELLFANGCASNEKAVQNTAAVTAYPRMESLGPSVFDAVMTSRRDGRQTGLSKVCTSPSQIETYLECPYQWFATRRLHVEELDEGFGPIERGSFAHVVLELFYRRFQNSGHVKVSEDNLDAARSLMREITSEVVQKQFLQEPGNGRLVYTGELERREVIALCDQLVSFLDFEVSLLPAFHPAYFEYEIESGCTVDYADVALVGKVDRIDVDDCGHAVIIDYKGSVNDEHNIAGKGFLHAGKVQARIYAQAIKRMLGLDVIGALYVSYGRKPALAGAYDSRVIESAHLPNMRHDRCACGLLEEVPEEAPDDFSFSALSFGCMLDATEQVVRKAVARMCAGDVAPSPALSATCSFCPVLACPKRGA